MYVNNTNILLLMYNVYIYDYSFGENKNKNKRTLIVKLKETRNFSKYFSDNELGCNTPAMVRSKENKYM